VTAVETGQGKLSRGQRFVSPLLWAALLIGVCVHLVGFLVFKIVSNPLPEHEDVKPLVSFLSAGAIAEDMELSERALLFDSAPLFIPTRWNAAAHEYVSRDNVIWLFPEYEPEINLMHDLRPATPVLMSGYEVEAPQDLLDSKYWQFFRDFSQERVVVPELQETVGFAEIRVVGSPERPPVVLGADVEYAGAIAREPAVFALHVNGSGELLSQPLLVRSSGSESFDQSAREWLRAPTTVARLPAGYVGARVFP